MENLEPSLRSRTLAAVAPGAVSERRTWRLMLAVSLLYFASSWIQGPVDPAQAEGILHLRIGHAIIAPPMVLSGDSPHYLVIVNSLIEDGDFDVSNNYDQALAGDWDAGARFRRFPIDRHIDQATDGKQYSFHPPFMPMILAAFVFPLRGTRWVEPACIWVVMAFTLLAVWRFAWKTGDFGFWAALLALGTPLWCYSRDLWTEPWTTAIWIGLLFSRSASARSIPAQGALAALGTVIRYPFLAAVGAMSAVSWWEGDRRRAWALAGGGALGLIVAVGAIQWIFRDVGHFSLLHMGTHSARGGMSQIVAPFGNPLRGLVGLLFDPKDGLLIFFPCFLWGFPRLVTGFRRYLPVLVYYVLNASYVIWDAGSGFSARYLVPALPAAILAIRERRPRGWLFWLAVVWGLGWGFIAGVYPAMAYDRSAWQMIVHVWRHLT